MKKLYILLFYFISLQLMFSSKTLAQCPAWSLKTIGHSQPAVMHSITSALAYLSSKLINCGGTLPHSFTFELASDYNLADETFPIVIPANLGTSTGNTITFRPAAGLSNILITSANDNGTIQLNGATNIIFDGRAGGVGTNNNLTIENTSVNYGYSTVTAASGTSLTLTDASSFAVGMQLGVGPGGGIFASGTTIKGISGNVLTLSAAPQTPIVVSTANVVGSYSPAAITFINDASNNTITYCNVKSASKSESSGTIFFSTGISTGNNNNTISNCEISDASEGTPLFSIYSYGSLSSSAIYNKGNNILNNNIHDFAGSTTVPQASPAGIMLRASTDWVIDGNSIYQTISRYLPIINVQFNGINVTNVGIGNNHTITNNFIGGQAPQAGGGALTITGSGQFSGIGVYSGTGTKSTISGNTIANINFTSNGISANFRPINLFQGILDCYNNTIGSKSISNSIKLYLSNYGSSSSNTTKGAMISSGGSATLTTGMSVAIHNNYIGNIFYSTSGNTCAFNEFKGIHLQGVPDSYSVTYNTIEKITSWANSVTFGIYSSSTSSSNNISNNIISGINNISTGSSAILHGIYTTGSANYNIQGNNINNLSAAIIASGVNVTGINISSTGTNNTIAQDTIAVLKSITSTSTADVAGINTSAVSGGIISKNIIYGLTNDGVGSFIKGYNCQGGTWGVSNNMISLSNAAKNNSVNIYGIADQTTASGTRNYYLNSIDIAGNGVNDATSTLSACLLFNCPLSGGGVLNIKNNILQMDRTKSGGAGHFYSIANNSVNLTGLTSNNNILNNVDTNSVGLFGSTGTSDKTFATWKSSTGKDAASYSAENVPFVNTSAGNLHIDLTNNTLIDNLYLSNIESKGEDIGIYTDIDGDTRPGPTGSTRGGAIASTTDIGADEVDLAYNNGDAIWSGSISTDWTDANNWILGIIPTLTTNTYIPTGRTNYPVISTSQSVKNLTIDNGATTIINSNGTLTLKASFINDGTLTNNGTIIFNGSSAQTMSGAGTAVMNNVTVNNNSLGGLTLSQPFSISGALTPTMGTIILNNVDITLKSTATNTASVGQVGGSFSYTGAGKFIIERYIPAHKSWRLLTSPTTFSSGQTINAAWQEGATPRWPMQAEPVASVYNPNPTYGTHISGSVANIGLGFDQNTTGNSSIKYFSSNNWIAVPNTLSTKITDYPGFMLFVRGDRSLDLTLGTGITPNATTLRSAGQLKTGAISIPVNGTAIVGNPYASAIDFNKIFAAGGLSNNTYYLWDPNLTGSNSVGAWVTFTSNGAGGYDRTDSIGGISSSNISANGIIESGAAFMVNQTGSIKFDENVKSNGAASNAMFRPSRQARVNLLAKNNDSTISMNDGLLVTYGKEYSNSIDVNDAIKMINFSENIASKRDGKLLAIERRKLIAETDTIYIDLQKMAYKNYLIDIKMDNLEKNNLAAFIQDAYLNKIVPISFKTSNRLAFVVNSNATSYKDRFKLIFKPSVKFTAFTANLLDENIVLNWAVASEYNLAQYIIERSTNGIDFSTIGTLTSLKDSNSTVQYTLTDNNVPSGSSYYYRVKSISKAGVVAYSDLVKIIVVKNTPSFYVYPNPVQTNIIQLQVNEKVFGNYGIEFTTSGGQLILSKTIAHNTNQPILITPPSKLVAGTYLLKVIAPNQKISNVKVEVE